MNGRDVQAGQHPSTVFIQAEGAVRRCSAVVINANLIFTAGHCLEGVEKTKISVKISNKASGFDYTTIRASWKLVNSPFVETVADIHRDFAFLKTNDNLLERLNLQANDLINLPTDPDFYSRMVKDPSTKFLAVGYGIFNAKEEDGKKKELRLEVSPDDKYHYLSARSLEPNVGICPGDSGGGLFADYQGKRYLVGILSGKIPDLACEDSNNRGFYLMIQPMICWAQAKSESDLNCKK